VKSPKDGPKVTKPNWRIIVYEQTQLKFSNFFETKNGMVEPTCEQFQQWKDVGKEVCYICMDNAGKNTALQQQCDSANWKFNIKFEFMAMTPQQKNLAEVGFSVLANCGRALMERGNIPMKVQYKVWKMPLKWVPCQMV
jgi:hypothetical protein